MNTEPGSYKYQVGGSLETNAPSYVVRQADQEFYEALRSGEFCYVLNSRQMGKSSLRVQTMRRLRTEGIACGVIDITRIGSHNITPEQWYLGVLRGLAQSFGTQVKPLSWWQDYAGLSPVQRLGEFIDEVLLKETTQPIVIFIDEIDSILSLEFKDDFFALIRTFYNQRADQPEYHRLTFALLGVATPSSLIQDKSRTPFNIGQAIQLEGFQSHEMTSLTQGLAETAANPAAVLREILHWTGGQPFLTQKLCQLVRTAGSSIAEGQEAKQVEQMVQTGMVANWEFQDEPVHLKTIRDRILSNERRASRLLGLYQKVLQGTVTADDSPEQMELRLSGLVVKREGKLEVYNPIYGRVFNREWLDQALAKLRPYAVALERWLASEQQDESRLLRGKALQDAQAWAAGKSLSDQDHWFLDASQKIEKQEVEQALATQRQANQILTEAQEKAEEALTTANERLVKIQEETDKAVRRGRRVSAVAGMAVLIAAGAAIAIRHQFEQTRQQFEQSVAAIARLRSVRSGEKPPEEAFDALLEAMQAGQQLKSLDKSLWEKENTKTLVVTALQQALGRVRGRISFDRKHNGSIMSVNFSPDGKTIATASSDKTVKLWNLEGKELRTLKGHQDYVKSVSFSPDGKTIATASYDRTVKLWNLKGKELRTLKGHQDYVKSVSFSPDGKTIATASFDRTVKLWNLEGKELRTLKGHQGYLSSVSFSPDGKTIATASYDRTVKLWNLEGKELRTLKGHQDYVNSVCFSPDGKTIATASDDKTVKLWSLEGKELRTLKGHQKYVNSVSFSPDGKTIATASYDKTVKLWNLEGKELQTLKGHQDYIWSVSFSPDGRTIATASNDKTVKLWSLESIELQTLKQYLDAANHLSFSPDGKTIITTTSDQALKPEEFDPDSLIALGCYWLRGYLASHSSEGLEICNHPLELTAAAPTLVAQGRREAETGNLQEAIVSFQEAKRLDTRLQFDPETEAKTLDIPRFVGRGIQLAKEGNIQDAIARFQDAKKLDPSLKLDPETEAKSLAVPFFVAQGEQLTEEGKIQGAIAAFKEAQTLNPNVEISAESWNKLCWRGSINRHEREVLFACDKAVELDPGNGGIQDSRGLARALMGDTEGARKDFDAYIQWAGARWPDRVAQRQRWIDALGKGKDPFTKKELESIRNQ